MHLLNLTLFKKWFDLVLRGKKKEEYREFKPYWQKRLNKDYEAILFRNGYFSKSPSMLVEYKGKTIKMHEGKKCFALKLGKIIETHNLK